METVDLHTQTFHIDGMTCLNCQNRIEKKLKNTAGIQNVSVSYKTGKAAVIYNAAIITLNEIVTVIENLGYKAGETSSSNKITNIIGTLVIIFVLYMLLRAFSASSLATAFPTAQTGMSYGMVLIIGLLTSAHCIAMCGGINLSQTLKSENREQRTENKGRNSLLTIHCSLFPVLYSLLPAVLYNAGRVISYTAVGIVVGALGSVITVSGRFQGAVLLLAGIFMLVMGINMLGLFPALRRFNIPMPKIFTQKIHEHKSGKGPLVVGFLNGFIPCGPLQAMQLYALSTGSPLRGGISMFLFCIGTIPLMFALGAAGSILSGAKGQTFSRHALQIGAVLVAAMGLTMFTNGWNLAGLDNPVNRVAAVFNSPKPESGALRPVIQGDVQVINSTLLPGRYPAITVQQGIPVRWTINAPQGSINGCNNRVIIKEYGIEHTFRPGDNVIEFLPARTGRFSYSCWMGMIRSSITVVAEAEGGTVSEPDLVPAPAGVTIPTDKIALAQITGSYQMVEIQLTDDGFEPAIIVMQQWLPALWNIKIDSLDPGSSALIFPNYYTVLEVEQGDNPIRIAPEEDFEFSTVDNVFYGFVKVVSDINNVNIDAIKAEVAEHETLIYPQAYFEAADGGR